MQSLSFGRLAEENRGGRSPAVDAMDARSACGCVWLRHAGDAFIRW
jgi:hypothetical protein